MIIQPVLQLPRKVRKDVVVMKPHALMRIKGYIPQYEMKCSLPLSPKKLAYCIPVRLVAVMHDPIR
jgi:hypothetical protein